MTDSQTVPSAARFEVRTTSDSHFSWLRTRLSLERTMMSWQRTAVALISCGILALVISLWQYRWTIHYLWGGSFAPIAGMRADATKEKMQSPVMAVAVLLILIGLFAFFAVLLRLT